jgi:uncharacterized protein (TIGR02466 family)
MLDENPNPLADMARNGQIEQVFSTPIFSHVLKDCASINAELLELILAREVKTTSPTKSNLGGWQSSPDFFNWAGSAVSNLESFVRCALDVATIRITAPPILRAAFEVYGWAAVNRAGHYNTTHVHPMATWSGVYYVDPGDGSPDSTDGYLEFTHPVVASALTFFPSVLPSARLIAPKPGMIILFPSYMLHGVRIYKGERPRVCIAFNAHLRDLACCPEPKPG